MPASERLVAFAAFKWLRARVQASMVPQVAWGGKEFLANVACERFSGVMAPFVISQNAQIAEADATFVASVRLLDSVPGFSVDAQRLASRKAAIARVARVRLLAGMRPLVHY